MSLTFEITFVDDELLDSLGSADDERLASIMFKEGRPSVSLGRSWHIIHTLLTGSPHRSTGPRSFIFGGGRPLGAPDPNGGWVCAYGSGKVAAIEAVLPTAEGLERRYAEVGVPSDVAWASRLKTSGAEYFLEVYRELLEGMKKAVEEGHGMLAGLI